MANQMVAVALCKIHSRADYFEVRLEAFKASAAEDARCVVEIEIYKEDSNMARRKE